MKRPFVLLAAAVAGLAACGPSIRGASTPPSTHRLPRAVHEDPVTGGSRAPTSPPKSHGRRHTATFPGRAPYSVPLRRLDKALACTPAAAADAKSEPVLLVHGLAVNRESTWRWNLWTVLPEAGFDVCWVQLPDAALNDNQTSAEYVARAVETMARRYTTKVDVVAHSQGAAVSRWALKWFPSGARVDDLVSLAGANHGSAVADAVTLLGRCSPACWQLRRDSRFIDALNAGDETPGPLSYTSIYTTFDELVVPHSSSALQGATNIVIQDLCPGRPVDHFDILGDAVTYELTLDALTRAGPAAPSRMPADLCRRTSIARTTDASDEAPDWRGSRLTRREPSLRAYARR